MNSRDNGFFFNPNYDFGTESVFKGGEDNFLKIIPPPPGNFFLFLNGNDFLLLNGDNLSLL